MTKDNTIRMAREAGALVSPGISSTDVTFSPAALERFYNLAAAAQPVQPACVACSIPFACFSEDSKCALPGCPNPRPGLCAPYAPTNIAQPVPPAEQNAKDAERERCALVCETMAAIQAESARFCKVGNIDQRDFAICAAAIRQGGVL